MDMLTEKKTKSQTPNPSLLTSKQGEAKDTKYYVQTATKSKFTRKKKLGSRKKPPSISALIKLCDAAFSSTVRRINSAGILNEINACFTCGRFYPIKKLHCGHYLSRFYKAARWDFDNARPQCMMCNLWKRGDPVVFRQNLVKEIGLERVLAVESKRSVSIKLTREYLEALLATLSDKV